MRLLASIVFCCVAACGTPHSQGAPEEAPPPIRTLGPPSVPVPQVAPSTPRNPRFFGDGLVFVTDLGVAFVWEPASARVLYVGALPPIYSSRLDVFPAGIATDRALIRASATQRFEWQELELAWDETRVIAPTLDAFFQIESGDRRELVVRGLDGAERARFGVGEVLAQFTSDGSRVLTCDPAGAELHDAGTGRWLGAWRGEVTGCSAGPGSAPVVVSSGRTVHLLDPHTLAPLGEPIESVRAARASSDGRHLAVVTSGSREGISVLELPSRREVFHRSMPAPQSVQVEGGVVVYASGRGSPFSGDSTERGGAFRIGEELAGTEIVAERDDFGTEQLGPDGSLLVQEDGVLTLRNSSGEVAARYDAPPLVSLRPARGELFATGARESAWRVSRAMRSQRFGVCPASRSSRGMFGLMGDADAPHALVTPAGWRRIRQGCLARDDGTTVSGSFNPLRSGFEAWDARGAVAPVFVSYDEGPLVVYDAEGVRLAQLALDHDERPACRDARGCALPIQVSADGALVAVARGSRLRIFDARTGARLGQASVGERTAYMFFTDERALLHVDNQGHASVFHLAPRGRLLRVAHWEVTLQARRSRSIQLVPGGFLEDGQTRVLLRDARGAIRAQREVPADHGPLTWTGSLVVVPTTPVVVLESDDLEVLGTLEGELRGAAARDVFTCVEGSLVRTTWEGATPRTRALQLRCGSVAPLGDDAFVVTDRDTAGTVLLRQDDVHLETIAVQRGDDVHLGALDRNRTSAISVLLRRPELTSEGMVPAPRGPPLSAWLTPVRHPHDE